MKWVTFHHVHLDRVACPWLIRRYIDPGAEFVFIPRGGEGSLPADATPFAIAGTELGPHDAEGTTFHKMLRKYNLEDPALAMVAEVIASGVHHTLHRGQPDQNDVPVPEGIGLSSLSEGMMLVTDGDLDNIDKSMAIYDALYATCKARVSLEKDPSLAEKGFLERAGLLKEIVKASLPR